ncbi:MAG: recombinase [Pasteurellaceae bacterium]|nr:recombinase [Pasteurellaceae bacterium]
MQPIILLSQANLARFIEQKLNENQTFELLEGLFEWLRHGTENSAEQRLYMLIRLLKTQPELGQQFASQLCRWLCRLRIYPLLISRGILSREGFGREMRTRLYEKFNPAFKDVNDLRDVFFLLFNDKNDGEWLKQIPMQHWDTLLNLLRHYATPHERETLNNHVRYEGLFAIEMLSIWIAAEEMDPELMRLDRSLLDADSPFVSLQREVSHWVDAQRKQEQYDVRHLEVMFEQCQALIERLQKKGSSEGSSLGVAHLLERLSQTLVRLAELMDVFSANRFLPRRILLLTGELAIASADQHSVSKLWKQSVRMLSRTITQNTSDHGEHYITRNRSEYFSMLYSAAGGGILIALMALIKIYIGNVVDDKVSRSLLEALNYGIGFVIIFMLHFTVATKQPAMTAARFAEAVDNPQGKGVNMKLAQLLVDVCRSQTVAVFGNVSVAVCLAMLLASLYAIFADQPLLDAEQVAYQLHSIDLFAGTLWFAAIAGVWLFCSGIISGYFDNRSNYLNLRMRLREHPMLQKWLKTPTRERVADYLHDNYGSIMGNLCFGFLLGLTGLIGYWTGLPLDIRHVAFSSANLGYATISGELSTGTFLLGLCYVLLIGLVNLIVSFSLTLWLALRSLGAEIDSWKAIIECVKTIIKQRPLSVILPMQLESK